MHFETTVEIEAPAEKVWATLLDVDRWPEWTASVTKVERLTDGALAPAAKVRMVQPRLRPLVWEVTDLEPERAFTWRADSPGLKIVATHDIRPGANNRVEVTLGVDQSGALAPVIGLFVSRTAKRYVEMEAAGLKHRCES